ncbi:putative dynein heavy chain [Trypanosoma conorhini]|uniref:Putative dynein heavy chain n=1 Tax=Trypanosoma conorhini TaxID=83891 RepID=A0A422PJQ6_9TRYP|nr:putative dynein heavy chain [Trypanosoma conorhini]RNF17958.1 putative dynein heavy chain [Trypanosoma conorhini]
MAAAVTGEGALRRAYTRSMPAVLRPLPLLEESMTDVQLQWEEVLEEIMEDEVATSSVHAAVQRVERLASQLKAIKQELLPQMKHFPHHEAASELSFLQYCSRSARAHAIGDPRTRDVVQGEQTRATRLAACVWVWSVCVGTILNDMELISSSLSFAASTGLLDNLTEEVRHAEANAFFLGKIACDEPTLSDADILLACQLFYHLFTGDDAAAELVFCRVMSLLDDCEERDDGKECRGCMLSRLARLAEWVASEDYAALQAFMKPDFPTGGDASYSLPPLIFFFTQVMLDMVVHRQLLQRSFQNAWRPVINVDKPVRCNLRSASSGARMTPSCDASWLSTATKKRLRACSMFRRESLPPRAPWPVPEALVDSCFRMEW